MLLVFASALCLVAGLCEANSTIYDRYTGKPASPELLAIFEAKNVTSNCTMEIEACDANERRRVDGSCNSLQNPARGTYFVPPRRELPAEYYNGSYAKKAVDGSELMAPRKIREILLCTGKASSLDFTHAMTAFGIWSFGEIGFIHDIIKFVSEKTDCCTKEHMNDYECTPNFIDDDDPVHQFDDIRCLNLTRPLVYSDFGCTNDSVPTPIEKATPAHDMSAIYNIFGNGDAAVRSYKDGLLSTDTDSKGLTWPPNGPDGFCVANQPGETRCFGQYNTALLPTMLLSVYYFRNHNYFASKLKEVNPCWNDEQLFQTARDMNIAFQSQVFFYEWLSEILGEENLVKNNIISKDPGFRNLYDPNSHPEVTLEYTYVLRWFHTAQENDVFMYDKDSNYLRTYPVVNVTFRPGFLDVENNMVELQKHMHLQACGGIDQTADPGLTENGLPYVQRSVDVLASDLHKSRLLGFPGYTKYVKLCFGDEIKRFEDLEKYIEPTQIEKLKQCYKSVDDIDLMAGMWTEKNIEGGSIPALVGSLMLRYLKTVMTSDRHWYESDERPYAFSATQLKEIRKASYALLVCTNGDEISEIQRRGFRVITKDNPLVPCSEIPAIDFTAWADPTCASTSGTDASSDSSSTSDASTSDDTTTSDATASSESSSTADASTSDDTTTSDATASSESSSTSDTSTSDDTTTTDATASSESSS